MKTCSNCKKEKDLKDFPKRSDSPDGRRGECRSCFNYKKDQYRKENIEQDGERKRRFRENNPNHVREYHKRWRDENRDHVNKKSRQWYRENIDRAKEIKNDWEARNPERVKEKNRAWYENNKSHVRSVQREYRRNRYGSDPEYRLVAIMRPSVQRILSKRKGSISSTKLGYTANQLKGRIECQFRPGMSWSNYGTQWEIDHCIPIKYFLEKGETRPHIISALANLQPLWKEENRTKGSKY